MWQNFVSSNSKEVKSLEFTRVQIIIRQKGILQLLLLYIDIYITPRLGKTGINTQGRKINQEAAIAANLIKLHNYLQKKKSKTVTSRLNWITCCCCWRHDQCSSRLMPVYQIPSEYKISNDSGTGYHTKTNIFCMLLKYLKIHIILLHINKHAVRWHQFEISNPNIKN